MRLWSLHPKYLDAKGLVALWREGLLAKHVLEGKTKGYTRHPQLQRFTNCTEPLIAINHYLLSVYEEACYRSYNFNKEKITISSCSFKIDVTDGQLQYEVKHLLKKLKIRDKESYKLLKAFKNIDPHPIFKVRQGEIEKWEIIDIL